MAQNGPKKLEVHQFNLGVIHGDVLYFSWRNKQSHLDKLQYEYNVHIQRIYIYMNMKLYGFCKPSINPSLGWFPRTLGILLDWFHLISSHHFTLRNIWAKDVMEKSPYV
jgi:hypothetical protein